MIVRRATAADVRTAFARISAHSAGEFSAVAHGAGLTLADLEAGMLKARRGPGLIAMPALCDPRTDKPGALFIVARGEKGEAELAGFTTADFPAIQRAFWIWAGRRFLPELVDRHAFRSHCSVVEGHAQWLAMLLRLGFRETGRYRQNGRAFIDLTRIRPLAPGRLTVAVTA